MRILKRAGKGAEKLLTSCAVSMIAAYKLFVSPLLGERCRFYPTCSHYCSEALRRHGLFKGGFLAMRRILRCHPACEGGVDEVPRD